MLNKILSLGAFSLLGAAAGFTTQIILARNLGPEDYGAFSTVLAAVAIITPLAGFGVGGFLLQRFGQEGWDGLRWVRPSIYFSLLSTITVISAVLVWALVGPHEQTSEALYTTLSFCIVGTVTVAFVSAGYQIEERFERLAFWQFSPHMLRLAFVGLLALSFGSELSVVTVAAGYAVASFVLVSIGSLPIRRMLYGEIALKGHNDTRSDPSNNQFAASPSIASVASKAWPFGMAAFLHLVMYQSDIVLLKYLSGDDAAGFYNVAFLFLSTVYMLPFVIYQKYLLPKVHRWANHDLPTLYRLYAKGGRLMIIFGVLIMTLVLAFGPYAVRILFGEPFAASATLLQILAFAIPLRFALTSMGATLVTPDNIRRKTGCMAVVAALNIVLNLILIPIYSASGAAFATVISEAALLLLFYRCVRKFVFPKNMSSEESP